MKIFIEKEKKRRSRERDRVCKTKLRGTNRMIMNKQQHQQKKNKTEVFFYMSSIPQTILLSYKHVFQFAIKKKERFIV